MKVFQAVIFNIFLLFIVQVLSAQTCYKYHLETGCAKTGKGNFKLYGQSKSASLEIDSVATLPVMFYGKKDYIVTVCSEKGYHPVHFVIRNSETGAIFYDNMEDEYLESVGFTIDHPQKLEIDVVILAESKWADDFGESIACVGVHIQWRRTEKIGF